MKKKFFTLLTLLSSLVFLLTGCNTEKVATELPSNIKNALCKILGEEVIELESKEDLVVILQRGMNNMPSFDNSVLEDYFSDVVKNGTIHFIVPDSTPESNFESLTYEKLDATLPSNTIKKELQSRITNLNAFSYTLGAKSEECDLVRSLLLAKQLLDASESDHKKRIIICSNMLNTCKPFKFTTEMLDNLKISSIDILSGQNNIPDLSDCTVDVYFCGQVIDPQKELSQTEKFNLEDIWGYYFQIAKTKATFHKDFPKATSESNNKKEALPAVSCIDTTADADAVVLGQPIYINDEAVKFNPDEDTFKNPDIAYDILETYVDCINNFPGSILLLGTTARPEDAKADTCKDLSLRRAKRVKETLIELGVTNPNKLICAGGGYSTPWYKNDRNSNGDFVEAIGALNRNIILLSENSEQFTEMVSKYAE